MPSRVLNLVIPFWAALYFGVHLVSFSECFPDLTFLSVLLFLCLFFSLSIHFTVSILLPFPLACPSFSHGSRYSLSLSFCSFFVACVHSRSFS